MSAPVTPTQAPLDALARRRFWLETLRGSLPETGFPADGRRLPGAPRVGLDFELPPDLAAELGRLSRGRPLSLYLLLVAGMTALLHKYTGDTDLLVGSPAYVPEGSEGQRRNLVPLRLTVDPQAGFEQHLRAVVETARAAYAHQAQPFEELVQWLGPARRDERFALFDLLIALDPLHDGAYAHSVPADLVCGFRARGDAMSLRVTYRSGLYAAPAVRRVVAHLLHLLGELARQPRLPLAELELRTPHDERRLFDELLATARPLPARLVHELIEDQARCAPERVAVRDDAAQATYAELQAQAATRARALRALGVGPETLVTLYAPRGVSFLATLLAVWKAGGAYTPLDPGSPPRRSAQLLAQSRSTLLLLGDGLDPVPVLEALAPEVPRPRVVPLRELDEAAPGPAGWPAALPGNLAYVIYTSGSTGRPKGAMLEQGGMRNHLHTKIWDLELGPDDVLAQNSPPYVDVSVWQFLNVLLVGGRTEVVSDDVNRDAAALLSATEQRGITVLEIVPSQLRAMLDHLRASGVPRPNLARLRWLVVNGEVLPPELCRAWLALYPHARLINAYGPTECSDDVTHQHILTAPEPECLRVPIGRALPNQRLYVVDHALRLVPPGVAGELYIGGLGVGRGYLADPVRTAQSYRPDPYAGVPGARMYKTGDLIRYRDDGSLDFFGRIDHQVKLRGHRIELGEIEAQLVACPGVREAVVVVRQDGDGPQRLVAYLVGEPGMQAAELRAFLKERLQEHMLPAAFVWLPALPLLLNGKIDRRSLPEPRDDQHAHDTGFVAPRTPVERTLADLWAEVLRVRQVGIHDNFFDLGGHSLLATQLIARVRDTFGIELALVRLFEGPTVAELALAVTQAQAAQADPEELARLLAEVEGE